MPPLQKAKPARERILLTGPWGAGKSFAWCTVGSWLRRTKSAARMFVVDTDHAADRLAEGYDDWSNIVSHDCWTYQDTQTALMTFHGSKPTRDDFLVVDLADKLWNMSQDFFVEQAFGKNSATYFLQYKKAGGEGHALSGEYGVNWSIVNKQYGELMTQVLRWPGHVIACTPAEPVERPNSQGKGGDDKEVLDAFGKFGVKPAGQKALGFQFFTVLLLNPMRGQGEYRFTTMKDLNREQITGGLMKDFVMDYLVKVAGWTI